MWPAAYSFADFGLFALFIGISASILVHEVEKIK